MIWGSAHADMLCAWVLLLGAFSARAVRACPWHRDFGGVYTVVNKASGRRLVADRRGFYTSAENDILTGHLWHVAPDANSTHIFENVATGARIYAQMGADRQEGFFVLGGDSPVYRDQRWHIDCIPALGGCYIRNMKSLRNIVDDDGGLIATQVAPGAEAALWWFMRQDRDEISDASAGACELHLENQELAHKLHDLSARLRTSEAAREILEKQLRSMAEPDVWETFQVQLLQALAPWGLQTLALASIIILFGLCFRGGRPAALPPFGAFALQTSKTQVDGVDCRLVRVQCPGVRHQDIEVKLVPNGCHLSLRRPRTDDLQEATWQTRCCFDFAEGLFEFVEDQMQLEHGFLTLLFRQTHYQDRTIRFAQHFSLDAFDNELRWEVPGSYSSPLKGPGSSKSTASS